MAELPNVKLILGGKKNNQTTNRMTPKKANAKPSEKPMKTVPPKILTKVKNSELKPKILKTYKAQKVVTKSKNSEAVTKKLVPKTLAVMKQILQTTPKAQETKEVSKIPVHKKVKTNKVDVKKKTNVKKTEIKSVKEKTMQPKSTSKLTIKSGTMKQKEKLKPPKADDVKQTNAKNTQLPMKFKQVLKKKLSPLSDGGKIVIPKTPNVKNEQPVGNTSARMPIIYNDADGVSQ